MKPCLYSYYINVQSNTHIYMNLTYNINVYVYVTHLNLEEKKKSPLSFIIFTID